MHQPKISKRFAFLLLLQSTTRKASRAQCVEKRYNIPKKIDKMLKQTDKIAECARFLKLASNFLYLGRGVNFPVTLDYSLFLKLFLFRTARLRLPPRCIRSIARSFHLYMKKKTTFVHVPRTLKVGIFPYVERFF